MVRQCHSLGEKLTSGAVGLTESFMMLPGASVCGLVFSHPEAQFLASRADRGAPVPQIMGNCEVLQLTRCGADRGAPVPQIMGVSQWEVPQIQFIACFGGHPSLHGDRGFCKECMR